MVAALDVHELHHNADPVPDLAHAAREHGRHAKLLADLAQVDVLVLEREGRGAGRDLDAWHLGQGIDDVLGYAVTEVLVLRIGAHVGQRQDRYSLPRRRAPRLVRWRSFHVAIALS